MSANDVGTLEDAIQQSGENWLIDSFSPPSAAIDHLRSVLGEVDRLGRERLNGGAPDLSEAAIVNEFRRNPLRVRAFFQALGGSRTPSMLLMAWRVIQGMEIKHVHMWCNRQEGFELQVILESPYGGNDEEYLSNKIQDFSLFRHIGITEINGAPVFDGFYPLNLGKRPS